MTKITRSPVRAILKTDRFAFDQDLVLNKMIAKGVKGYTFQEEDIANART
jgi:hypothetical protein